ncbi:MAG: Mur ligase family protein, partial [Candidatus Caenarcaniphilales bacterium]|nr:Mur ligase family protein [Candidatus Caenarcaniphilales bacterium]
MNEKFLKFKNKCFTILGLGISGIASLDYLLKVASETKIKIFVSDTRSLDSLPEKLRQKLDSNKECLDYEFGSVHSEKCLESDYLLVSPGINPQEKIILDAKKAKVQVFTELELASQMMNKYICITGTNGKSTVSSWLSFVLESPLCGNIGIPCLEVLNSSDNKDDWYVLETSSFQLAHSNHLKPKIAAITNITPDHITWHGSWEEYINSKFKITEYQDS